MLSMVNSNDFNFNDVICLVAHTKLKFFLGGGFLLVQSCIEKDEWEKGQREGNRGDGKEIEGMGTKKEWCSRGRKNNK